MIESEDGAWRENFLENFSGNGDRSGRDEKYFHLLLHIYTGVDQLQKRGAGLELHSAFVRNRDQRQRERERKIERESAHEVGTASPCE